MIILSDDDIKKLNIESSDINHLVETTMKNKNEYILPPKNSIRTEKGFFNTMPCIVNNYYSCKVVTRNCDNSPSISGNILIYDVNTSNLLAMLDCSWITQMRTGSTAALSLSIFAKSDFYNISLIGIGNCMYSFMKCFIQLHPNRPVKIFIYKYKTHYEDFKRYFMNNANLDFVEVDNYTDLFHDADVIISAVTECTQLFHSDSNIYKPGCLIIPIHTKGFQNCDTTFDRVFVDDDSHVKSFGNYGKFKYYKEFTDVLNNKALGRQNDDERIIVYNIGTGILDNVISTHVISKHIRNIQF